jgi:hypothetical protein
VALPGETVRRLLDHALASGGAPLAFSGLSVEMQDGKVTRLYPWEGDFDPARVYKVALPGRFAEEVARPAGVDLPKAVPWATDLRRLFLHGVRRRQGVVTLKPALL